MASSAGMTQRLRAVPGRLWPGLDEILWNRARDREGRSGAAEYSNALSDLVARVAASSPPHVVVVPMTGPDVSSWKVAGGNFFYEIAQSAREYARDGSVTVFAVAPGEDAAQWHERLIRYLVDSRATHLIAQVESDPNAPDSWTWDVLWRELLQRWDGVLLGVMFDSAYRWLTIQTRRMARMSDRFVLVDICMPMDGSLVHGRPEVGPVNMPVSDASLAVIDAHTAGLTKEYDVSFIGALYPYRVEMIDALIEKGVNVVVNPHRSDVAHDLVESRANQPTYVDYMAGLKQSHMTINFSRSSAGDFQQLKTRVLEASAVGCVVLTDDVDRTDRFWAADEYGYFADPTDVPTVVQRFLADTAMLAHAQDSARARARSINVSSFWGGIDAVLRRRGLPSLLE